MPSDRSVSLGTLHLVGGCQMKETTVSASVGSRAKRIGPGDESPNKLHSSAMGYYASTS